MTGVTPPADPLPVPGGESRAVLMMVHPRLLFLYWVLDDGRRQVLHRAAGPAELRLEYSADGRRFTPASRQPFDFRAPNWYVQNEFVDCELRVRLGTLESGRFVEVLRSDPLRVPRQAPGSGKDTWLSREELRRRPAGPAGMVPRRAGPEPAAPAIVTSSPQSGAHWTAAAGRGAAARLESHPSERAAASGGDVCLVLHSHLPFVRHPERDYFLEEHWLFEAVTETYLPLLDGFDHLAADGVPGRVTLSLTPTLLAMLRDRVLMDKYERHLARICDLARREVARTRSDPDFGPLAGFYRDRLERLRDLLVDGYRRDPAARFAALEEQGRIEIVTSAATHGLLPHLRPDPRSLRAQIAVGVAEHRRHIGRAPRGIWIPECAYFEGLDALLADHGIEYFFVDTRAVRNASSRPRCGVHAPLLTPSGVVAFGRDEECSEQVWSADHGYPGDPVYRDFYRDIGYDLPEAEIKEFLDPAGGRGMTGLKYHRITGRQDQKEPYRRAAALRMVDAHAGDFVRRRVAQADRRARALRRRPLMVAMYDAELFGHWWFEGPEWLEAVLRRLPEAGIGVLSPGQYLDLNPRLQLAEPAGSSWGSGGYYEVWLSEPTDWIYPPLHDAGRRMAALAQRFDRPRPVERRLLAQAARELLLAQASDWPFMLKGRTAEGYARRRVQDHLAAFTSLARQIEDGPIDETVLAALEARDNLFPEIDYRMWRRA